MEDSVISQTEPVDAMHTKVKHEISTEASNMTTTRRVNLRDRQCAKIHTFSPSMNVSSLKKRMLLGLPILWNTSLALVRLCQ